MKKEHLIAFGITVLAVVVGVMIYNKASKQFPAMA